MSEQWGSVDGDANAQAIFSDRRAGLDLVATTVGVFFLGLVATGVWYGATGSHAALALEIILAAICTGGWVRKDLYATHSWVMVTERRAQLIEQKVQEIRGEAIINR